MNNCVYKFINRDNEIIYVGKAKNLKNRLSNHNHLTDDCYKELAYIMYASFDTEHEMDFAERYYIQKLTPKYNTILSDKPISFDCDELDEKIFNVYEVNEFVVERTLEQMTILKQENLSLDLDISIVELVGLMHILKSKNFKNIKNKKSSIKSYDYLLNIADKSVNKVSDEYIKSLQKKYNFLDLEICYKDINNINEYVNLINNEYLLEIRYKEKYKKDYKSKDFILKCK